jgi:hypothetical protein
MELSTVVKVYLVVSVLISIIYLGVGYYKGIFEGIIRKMGTMCWLMLFCCTGAVLLFYFDETMGDMIAWMFAGCIILCNFISMGYMLM